MHTRRQLPHRLSGGLRAWALGGVLLAATGCGTSRYVGSVGPSGVYGNLGYGLTLNLQAGELSARWKLISPEAPDDAPPGSAPEVLNAPLDLDGDGQLEGRETMRHLRPTLRLLARSSSAAGARLDVDVVILGGAEASRPLDDVARAARVELVGPPAGEDAWTELRVAPAFHARALSGPGFRLAVIDQVGFQGESAAEPRRHSVRVLLRAPDLTPALAADFDLVLSALSLASQAGPVSRQDKW